MNYIDALERIKNCLTDNNEENIKKLEDLYEFHKKNHAPKELLDGIVQLMCKLSPDRGEEKIKKAIREHKMTINYALKLAENDFRKNNFDNARVIFQILINEYDGKDKYKNTKDVEYHSFNNLFEEIIYKNLNPSKRTIVNIKEEFSALYLSYSNLLILNKEYNQAFKLLKKAALWNPVDVNVMFNCCEIYKIKKDFNKFLSMTKVAMKYAYKREDIGRCYRNLGYYYIEMKQYEVAILMYLLSIQYDPSNKTAQKELNYIQATSKLEIKLPTYENIGILLHENDIQYGLNNKILDLCYIYGKHCVDIYNDDLGYYFYSIFYELTGNTDVKNELQKIENKKEN